MPTDITPRVLSTTIDFNEDPTASLELALGVADYFGLNREEARHIAKEIGAAVSTWRNEAKRLGATSTEIDRTASAFEHEDLVLSLKE